MKIVGVCGRKGGSGKTTTAVHLAAEMKYRGLSTILVDCDTQGSAAHWSRPGHLPMKVEHRPLDADQNIGQWSAGIRALPATHLVLDSPPHLDAALGGVIGLSDVAVIPCGPSGLDLIATAETVELVRKIRDAKGNGMPKILLVPNRIDTRTASGRQLRGALADLGETVAPSLHSRTALADAFNLGVWVGEYAPGTSAHVEVQELAEFVMNLLDGKDRA